MTFKLQETEAQFLGRVQELASFLGWEWLHLDKAVNDRGYWRTPVRGPLGPGWPDLLLIKGDRIIAAELKADRGRVSQVQEQVMGILTRTGLVRVYVWRPSDWDQITEILGAENA